MWLFPTCRETPELTFMEVYDVRWVTNFDEKMTEIGGGSKKGEYNYLHTAKRYFYLLYLMINVFLENVSYKKRIFNA